MPRALGAIACGWALVAGFGGPLAAQSPPPTPSATLAVNATGAVLLGGKAIGPLGATPIYRRFAPRAYHVRPKPPSVAVDPDAPFDAVCRTAGWLQHAGGTTGFSVDVFVVPPDGFSGA